MTTLRKPSWLLLVLTLAATGVMLAACTTSFTMRLGPSPKPVSCGVYILPTLSEVPAVPTPDQMSGMNDEELALFYANEFIKLRARTTAERRELLNHHESYLTKCIGSLTTVVTE